jgi:hypothetical protein
MGKRLHVESVDLSQFIGEVTGEELPFDNSPGVPWSGMIQGDWDLGPLCSVCCERFEPGPEGVGHLVDTQTGESYGTVCVACGVAVAAPSESK